MARVKRIKQRTLAFLSRKKSLYSTRRLLESARARGFRARAIDVLKCNLVLETGKPRIFYRGKELRGISVAVPRIGASVTAAGLAVVRQLEAQGVPLLNGAAAIARSRDKLAAPPVGLFISHRTSIGRSGRSSAWITSSSSATR